MKNEANAMREQNIRAVRRIMLVEVEDASGRCKLRVQADGVELDDVRRMLEQAIAGANKEADRLHNLKRIEIASEVPKDVLAAAAKA